MSLFKGSTIPLSGIFAVKTPATLRPLNFWNAWASAHEFIPVKADQHSAFGACSYRNPLDGPTDAGLIDGDHWWVCGLRLDERKPSPAIVKAEQSRAIADLFTVNPKASRQDVAELKLKIRDEVALRYSPSTSFAQMAVNLDTGVLIVDKGGALAAKLGTVLDLTPVYRDGRSMSEALARIATKDFDASCSCTGYMLLEGPDKESLAISDPHASLGDAVRAADLRHKALVTVRRLSVLLAVPDLNVNTDVMLDSHAGAVRIGVPEGVGEGKTFDDRVASRLEFLSATMMEVASLYLSAMEPAGLLEFSNKRLLAIEAAVSAALDPAAASS